jgi:uncharacterized protein
MFLFTGPVLQILATIFEWIMGNFFSMMVFGVFSVFWLSFGLLQLPTLDLAAAYSTSGTDAVAGTGSRAYNAAIALYLVVWGCAMLTFWIFSLRTNLVFASIFILVAIADWILAAAFWKVADGRYEYAHTLQVVSCALYQISFVADDIADWRSLVLCRWLSRLVHDICHHGRGNATVYSLARGRSKSFVAENRHRNGGC